MAYAEGNTKEYNSLTSYGKEYEIHQEVPFHAIFGFHNDFFNSSALHLNENEIHNTLLAEPLTDKEYVKFLHKIEKDFNFVKDSSLSLYVVNEKFSEIYSKFFHFKFDSVSVEYTYDKSLLFSINNNGSRYLLEYYLDYKADLIDDVEIIFTKLNSTENKFYEMLLEDIHDFFNREFKTTESTSKNLIYH